MSEQDNGSSSSGNDELSGLGGFFFYIFIVHPLTAWILRPGRFERKRSIMYAILFLASLALFKTGLELQQRGVNYYRLLGVTRSSTPLEIKRAYKKLSLIYHPDKNSSPDAADQFDTIKRSYDVLMDLELRDVYNKFGPSGIKQNKRYSETQFLLEVAVYYVSYGMMAFLLTLGKKNGDSRNWIFTGLLCMLIIEVVIMTHQTTNNGMDSIIPVWLLPQFTEYEFIWLLHSLFPAFMNGCRSLGSYLYIDLDEQMKILLFSLHEQNKDILLVLRDVQINVQNIQMHGGGGGNHIQSTANMPVAGSDENNIPSSSRIYNAYPRATPTGKLSELQQRLQASNVNVAAAVNQLKSDKSSSSNMGFYLMIIAYIGVSYFFG